MLCYLTEVIENQWLCKCNDVLVNPAPECQAKFYDVNLAKSVSSRISKIKLRYIPKSFQYFELW